MLQTRKALYSIDAGMLGADLFRGAISAQESPLCKGTPACRGVQQGVFLLKLVRFVVPFSRVQPLIFSCSSTSKLCCSEMDVGRAVDRSLFRPSLRAVRQSLRFHPAPTPGMSEALRNPLVTLMNLSWLDLSISAVILVRGIGLSIFEFGCVTISPSLSLMAW